MQHSGLESCLNFAARTPEGVPLHVPKEWGEELIRKHSLKMECRNGDMTGEASALFKHWASQQTLWLKRDWRGYYMVYHGDWKPDPHWTGD